MGNKCDFYCNVCYEPCRINKKTKNIDHLDWALNSNFKECRKCYKLTKKEKIYIRQKKNEIFEKIKKEHDRKKKYYSNIQYHEHAVAPIFF